MDASGMAVSKQQHYNLGSGRSFLRVSGLLTFAASKLEIHIDNLNLVPSEKLNGSSRNHETMICGAN